MAPRAVDLDVRRARGYHEARMSWLPVVLGVCGGLGALVMLADSRARARRRRLYDAKVGLGLEELVALLPPHLRDRAYYGYIVAPEDGRCVSVGLTYRDDQLHKGNPPNVGLDFDLETGALVKVHEEGIGLGLK
jgi:hypothetical protein